MGCRQVRGAACPFLTCEPVLTETFFLVSGQSNGSRRFFDLLGSGLLEVDFSVIAEREALGKLVRKYQTCRCRSPMRAWFGSPNCNLAPAFSHSTRTFEYTARTVGSRFP